MHPHGENDPSSAAETGSVSIEEAQDCSLIDSYRTKEGEVATRKQASLHYDQSKSSSTLY
jgi:hypothetical protein